MPSGPASSWECRAAQSRQARPEEAQEPRWGAAKGTLCPCCGAEWVHGRTWMVKAEERNRQLWHGLPEAPYAVPYAAIRDRAAEVASA